MSPEVLSERAACLAVFDKIAKRLQAIEIDDQDGCALVCGDAFRLELRRIDAAIEGVRQGLHRTDPIPDNTKEGDA